MVIRPCVGSVILLRIFSRVDLPAPLRPMTPSTSPRLTSNETSLRAQKFSTESLAKEEFGGSETFEPFFPLNFLPMTLNGAAASRAITSRSVVYASPLFLWRNVYFLLTFSMEITVSDIHELLFLSP